VKGFRSIRKSSTKIMGTHVPREGEALLQGTCGEFDSHRLHHITGL